MATSRYSRTGVIDLGRQFGTGRAHEVIRKLVRDNAIPFKEITLHEAQRLDHIAGKEYGDGRYFWVIAAASDVGWSLQVPPGTHIVIPDLESVLKVVG